MIKDAEKDLGPVQASRDDPRVTRVGMLLRATAFDELPQLLNIVKGDMSFVGPRALRPSEREAGESIEISLFDIPGYQMRSSVRPGLTGVAQIFAPRDIPRVTKFKYDLWYIRHQNSILDLRLLALSLFITLNKKWEFKERKFKICAGYLEKKIVEEIATYNSPAQG